MQTMLSSRHGHSLPRCAQGFVYGIVVIVGMPRCRVVMFRINDSLDDLLRIGSSSFLESSVACAIS